MKKLIIVPALTLFALTGCGQSEAEKDYARCNEEYASGDECTEEEFREFLVLEAEDNAFFYGGIENATPETQKRITYEILDKVEEIFGE